MFSRWRSSITLHFSWGADSSVNPVSEHDERFPTVSHNRNILSCLFNRNTFATIDVIVLDSGDDCFLNDRRKFVHLEEDDGR